MSEAEAKGTKEATTMAELFETKHGKLQNYRAGKIIKAKIINANDTGIYVATGGKKDGFVPKTELSENGEFDINAYKNGDEIEVMIVENNNVDKTYVALSKKEADRVREGDKAALEVLKDKDAEFSMTVDRAVKGGLLGKLGSYTVFVPASHIRAGFVKNLEEYVGKTLRLKLLPEREFTEEQKAEKNDKISNPKRLVASQKIVLETEKQVREDEFWGHLEIGLIVTGKVKRFTDFGAFISVNGFDCLARKSDLSWTRIEKCEDVLTLKEKYDFVVLSIDREQGKVGLGYKQLQKTPYEIAAEKYHVGDVITGKVVRIAPFGAFISIEPGVDGLVHVSQVAHNYIKSPEEVLKVDEEIKAKIIKIDNEKITLSIKELIEKPIEAEGVSDEEQPGEKKGRGGKGKSEKKERAKKDSEELREWKSDGGSATLGDLFKDMNFEFKDED